MNVCYRMIFNYCLIYDIIKSTVSYVLLKKGIKLRHLPYLSRALDKKGEDQKARWQPIAFITSCKKIRNTGLATLKFSDAREIRTPYLFSSLYEKIRHTRLVADGTLFFKILISLAF